MVGPRGLKARFEAAGKRRAFRRAVRPSDVFIIGYPRSGTTWLAFMVANALTRRALTFAEVDELVPDVNNEYFWGKGSLDRHEKLADPRFFRVHALHDDAFPRAVYLVRDPRDTLVSNYHFQRFYRDDVGSLREYVLNEPHFPSAWDEHVRGWLEHAGRQVLVVRYEAMRADPVTALSSVLAFVGVDRDSSAVEAAVASSGLERMQALELRERDVIGSPVTPEERAVRRGVVGGWRDEMDVQLAAELETRFGTLMDELGYERVAR